MTTLSLPLPVLTKGRFASLDAYTDESLFEACGVRIAFTTRQGGVSAGPYASLNLGSHVDDDLSLVEKNRKIVLSSLSCGDAPLIVPKQVHGDRVLSVSDAKDVRAVADDAAQGADGIVVGASRVAALLCFADCVPVIIVSPTGRFAVVHAGWRGVENTFPRRPLRFFLPKMPALWARARREGTTSTSGRISEANASKPAPTFMSASFRVSVQHALPMILMSICSLH